MSEIKEFETGRLAFRHEGKVVNCYIATTDTMEGAKWIASMDYRMLQANPGLFEKWQDLMREPFAALLREIFGTEPARWERRKAPESERSGHS